MSNSPSGKFDLPDVGLDGRDASGGRPADPLPGPVEHRLAQVDQGGIEVRQELQQLEGVVAGPAAHVENVAGVGVVAAAAWATSAIASGASTVADWPVSRLENRSTSASNRCRISSTVDFITSSNGGIALEWTVREGIDNKVMNSGAVHHIASCVGAVAARLFDSRRPGFAKSGFTFFGLSNFFEWAKQNSIFASIPAKPPAIDM